MAEEAPKWDKMLVGMIKATNRDELRWVIKKYDDSELDTDEKVDCVYETKYNDRILEIYKRMYKAYRGVTISPLPTSTVLSILQTAKKFDPDPNEKIWFTEYIMKIEDTSGLLLFQISHNYSLRDLYNVVAEKVANLEDIKEHFENLE